MIKSGLFICALWTSIPAFLLQLEGADDILAIFSASFEAESQNSILANNSEVLCKVRSSEELCRGELFVGDVGLVDQEHCRITQQIQTIVESGAAGAILAGETEVASAIPSNLPILVLNKRIFKTLVQVISDRASRLLVTCPSHSMLGTVEVHSSDLPVPLSRRQSASEQVNSSAWKKASEQRKLGDASSSSSSSSHSYSTQHGTVHAATSQTCDSSICIAVLSSILGVVMCPSRSLVIAVFLFWLIRRIRRRTQQEKIRTSSELHLYSFTPDMLTCGFVSCPICLAEYISMQFHGRHTGEVHVVHAHLSRRVSRRVAEPLPEETEMSCVNARQMLAEPVCGNSLQHGLYQTPDCHQRQPCLERSAE